MRHGEFKLCHGQNFHSGCDGMIHPLKISTVSTSDFSFSLCILEIQWNSQLFGYKEKLVKLFYLFGLFTYLVISGRGAQRENERETLKLTPCSASSPV